MRYFYGEFPFSFQSFPRQTTIRFVFSTVHRQVIFAEGLDEGTFVIIGPDHFPEIEAHLLSQEMDLDQFKLSNYPPEFCISHFIYIKARLEGQEYEFPLAELEANVEAHINAPEGLAETFLPEVVLGLFDAIMSITGPEMKIPEAKRLYDDVLHRLSGEEGAYIEYQAKTLRPLIILLKKLFLRMAEEENA